jgi:hypothetical protein
LDVIRPIAIWTALILALGVPLAAAAFSPLLAWRDPVYILAGFAGIIAMGLMLPQPLLAAGYLPAMPAPRGRRVHRLVGIVLVLALVIHVAALWITSPPDVVDVLLFRSPAPFSLWGVVAMWAVFAAAFLALVRRRLPLRLWRVGHSVLVSAAVLSTVIHVVLIEGTMEIISKYLLSILVLLAVGKAVYDLRAWAFKRRTDG